MDTRHLLTSLNWFYTLELNQVELYQVQSRHVTDFYLKRVLERAAGIEQAHVDNISAKIKELGAQPSSLGNVLAPFLGSAGGSLTSWLGVVPMLKANIILETKAMTHYKELILRVGEDEQLFDLLWSNLIDEDLHTSWFTSKVQELEGRLT